MGVRDLDENNLSHHFLEEVAAYSRVNWEVRALKGFRLCHNLT